MYILLLSDGTFYTGITGRLKERMLEHKRGQSKSTKERLPAKLVWISECENRQLCRELEVRIKGRGAKRHMKTYKQGNLGDIIPRHINKTIFR